MIEKIRQYINSVVLEMKKVTWLSKDELISSTLVVGIFSVIVAIFLFFVDFGISEFISKLLGGK
ncbi:MAG: preprotein translocase subunit SecE [Candidatus Marinimicrobia bacterium]|nr:preprotein translocase subunit SecE [Candidatus Neomarinimicrobiota bacterium]